MLFMDSAALKMKLSRICWTKSLGRHARGKWAARLEGDLHLAQEPVAQAA